MASLCHMHQFSSEEALKRDQGKCRTDLPKECVRYEDMDQGDQVQFVRKLADQIFFLPFPSKFELKKYNHLGHKVHTA